ncbi:hypothetical protein FACS189468_0930 [Spirochaetia bacterium]|nr:hypothetical protein FACS189468_0930 [Spirochaetia bacterium]
MYSDPLLNKALSLTRRGRYDEAIKSLEIEVVRYRDSFRYCYILGIACLYAGDFGGASDYFKRARDLKMRDPGTLLAMAVLFLRRGEADRALDLYLEVQDLDKGNRIVRRALRVIRKYSGTEVFSAWLELGKLPSLYPPIPRPALSGKRLLPAAAIVVLAGLVLGGVFLFQSKIRSSFTRGPERSGLGSSVLEQAEKADPVEIGGAYRYILKPAEVLSTYEEARTRFNQHRDEAAKVALNRLIASNASSAIKNKARILLSYTEKPGFDTLSKKDRFTWTEVSKDPFLYRDCYVLWRGSAANIETFPESISFDFLVGYDTRKTMDGIVQVTLRDPDQFRALNSEQPLEVLGRVIPLPGTEKELFILEGAAIHQAVTLE